MKNLLLCALLFALSLTFGITARSQSSKTSTGVAKVAAEPETGFVSIFDGKTFNGWKKAAEHPETWKIENGAFVAHGERCHLYYVGDPKPFKDFELKVDVMTQPNSNGGIYFHTQYQETSW